MRQLQLSSALVVPHAPVLLEGLGAPDPAREALRDAISEMAGDGGHSYGEPDATIVLSPHGRTAGVYRGASGSLDSAGVRGCDVDLTVAPELIQALAAAWGRPILDEPLDTAAVVALRLTRVRGPVVVACMSDITSKDGSQGPQQIEEGTGFAEALKAIDDDSSPAAALVATAHTGAALAERGPLGKRWSALELEEHVRKAVKSDPTRLSSLAFDLWLEAGSCSSGVLAALGRLAAGPGEVRAYDASLGVGYLVAELPL